MVFWTPASAAALSLARPPVPHSSTLYKLSKFASTGFTYGYLAMGEGLPFLLHDNQPTQQGLRAGDSVLVSMAITEGLKKLTREPRPDTGEPDSFPSGHSAATFAMATVRSQFSPGQTLYWYLGAGAVSISRLILNRHHVQDVFAGAALGYLVARVELSQPRGLALNPWVIRPTSAIQHLADQPGKSKWRYLIDPSSRTLGVVYTIGFR